MRKIFLATTAAAALVGSAALAAAQAPGGGQMKQPGAQQEQKGDFGGGSMMHQDSGAQSGEKSLDQDNSAQAPSKSGTPDQHSSRAGSVQLSEDQRSKIQTVIGQQHPTRVGSNIRFDISVGAAVPRSAHVEVLPDEVVDIVPEYKGFDYVMVGDELLIVDPRTLEIVAIIPA
jgi:hypothetical protein